MTYREGFSKRVKSNDQIDSFNKRDLACSTWGSEVVLCLVANFEWVVDSFRMSHGQSDNYRQ